MKEKPISSFLSLNNVQLHVQDWGGTGEPILLVHATGFLGRLYRPLAERLRNFGQVFTYDHRGHGDSCASADGEYTWDLALKDLENLIEAKGFKDLRIVGHSMGATIASVLAAERPDLIRCVVAIDPVLVDRPPPKALIGFTYLTGANHMRDTALKRRREFDSVESMYEDYSKKTQFSCWQKAILHDYCEFGTRPNANGKRELKCLPEVEAKIFGTAILFDGPRRILKGTKPILFLFAGHGSPGAAQAERISTQLKSSRVLMASKLGHLMIMEDPHYVADQIIDFLTKP